MTRADRLMCFTILVFHSMDVAWQSLTLKSRRDFFLNTAELFRQNIL